MKSKNYSKKILKVFKKRGFVFSEPDVLLDSNYIIQRSGENFKKLMLTFEDDSGKNMCLRPDLTVASCVKYLEKNSKGISKIYYSGQAYRRSNNSKDSIVNDQLGLEIIGSKKKYSDDKEIINTILKSINKIKIKDIAVNIGDVNLFKQLIESLKIPERWKLRLIRHFWRPNYFEDLLNRLETNSDIDPIAVDFDKKRFSEMKKLNQNHEIAGRKISEILFRFDKKIRDPRSFSEGKKTAKIIREFLKITCPIDQMDKCLKIFFKKYNIEKNLIKNVLPIKSLSKSNYKIIFSTNFGRDLEYYTGMVFEVSTLKNKKEIARGGRYDDLLKNLGSKRNVSAVGAAINLNNLSKGI
jgi:ATP phosphoribosyltransferase regulatory subunit|tara:strand:+ start:1565 stop:2626 length:1062 start_codon:yes stop_codon:yes gene_type:complete